MNAKIASNHTLTLNAIVTPGDYQAAANFGDPSSIASLPTNSTCFKAVSATLPEPAGILLILPGLSGRRKRV